MNTTNYENRLVKAFHEEVMPCLVFVSCTNNNTGETYSGTATVFGFGGSEREGFNPYLATAGHLIPDATSNTTIRLTRYHFGDLANPTARTAEFSTPFVKSNDTKMPAFIKMEDKIPTRNCFDIGLIRGPIVCTDGAPWFSGNPSENRLDVQPADTWVSEGSDVAWAGFPEIVAQVADRPQPCYFHGVVSSCLIRDDFQMYLLDGNNTFGVSGGPMWCINAKKDRPALFAVIAGYRYDGNAIQMPGFVAATPVQVLLKSIFTGY